MLLKKDKTVLKTYTTGSSDILMPPPEERLPPGKKPEDQPLSKFHALDSDGLAHPGEVLSNGHAFLYKGVPADTSQDIASLRPEESAGKYHFHLIFTFQVTSPKLNTGRVPMKS